MKKMLFRIFTVNTVLIPTRFIDVSDTGRIKPSYDDIVIEVEVPPPQGEWASPSFFLKNNLAFLDFFVKYTKIIFK